MEQDDTTRRDILKKYLVTMTNEQLKEMLDTQALTKLTVGRIQAILNRRKAL